MKIDRDWRDILRRAWSVRLMALAAALSAVEVALPFFAEEFSRGTFAALSGLAVAGALIARIVAQRGL